MCDEIVRVSTPEAAELTKLLENIFRSVNIALVNEMAMLTDRMGIDIWEVVDAAATKPYGFMRFEPGPGHGRPLPAGRPVLPHAGARASSTCRRSSSSSRARSTSRCPTTAWRRSSACSTTRGKPVKGAGSLVFGVSYKPGVGDVRESPALKIIALLRELGADLVYHDPHVPERCPTAACSSRGFDEALDDADLALIVTAHPGVDHEADRPARAARRSTCAA